MPQLQKFQDFAEQVLRAKHDFGSHVFKVALTNVAPAATNTVLVDITQVSGGAYTAGGYVLDGVTLTEAGGTAKVVITDEVITAAGGSIGPFRWAVVYNDSSSGKPLVGFADRGDSITLLDGEAVTLDFDPAAGVLTLA
ncbi:hypothetical protein [uncultured Massilia sp.]|uniref:hypothetical protein n=1 Tax=uncultured Massilia sp. TaxID=169973 RepID=UPI0025834868|nr:hypothetical protein [uncultured Massilia sp.]